MIFSKIKLLLTTRITYTIRKFKGSTINAITKRTRLLFFKNIYRKSRKSDSGNGGTMKSTEP